MNEDGFAALIFGFVVIGILTVIAVFHKEIFKWGEWLLR